MKSMHVEIGSFIMECDCLFDSDTREIFSGLQKPLDVNWKKQESEKQKQTWYENSSHVVRAFKVLDSFRENELLCDVKLETDDGTLVCGHKAVLASATPYFQAMFTNFEESKKSHVILRELDSSALKLLVDFIYTGQITVTEHNLQVLFHAANLLQVQDVKEACCDFLQTQLSPKNCLGFKGLISLYNCEEYLSSFKSYVLQNFLEVVENDEFFDLSYDELVEIISCNELNSSSEEKVFECVVDWVNHDIINRKNVFPQLIEHVRLPLVSKDYLYNRVKEEPLFKSSLECEELFDEALYFQLMKFVEPGVIRNQPRIPVVPNVILVIGREIGKPNSSIHWFHLSTNIWQLWPEIIVPPKFKGRLTVLNNQLLFFLQFDTGKVYRLDLFSPSPYFKKTESMLKSRNNIGLGVLDNCIYAVGGHAGSDLKSAEVFYSTTQKWEMISEMSVARVHCGVGVLNNHLYAVGGRNDGRYLKSVERYCPRTNTWTPVADMNERRSRVGVAVLNGVMYAVGGYNGSSLSSAEAYNPNSNTWTYVSDMHRSRKFPGVVVLNGLLYAVGKEDESFKFSAETYDPKSNIWTMLPGRINISDTFSGAVVIHTPPCLEI